MGVKTIFKVLPIPSLLAADSPGDTVVRRGCRSEVASVFSLAIGLLWFCRGDHPVKSCSQQCWLVLSFLLSGRLSELLQRFFGLTQR